jgi:xylan 1,4-beta-xylosidase
LQTVQVRVDVSQWVGGLEHTWNYIGYDECNYTHSPSGMALLKKLGKLEKPYYVRAHHMLCTSSGHGAYKWGSTNACTEDAEKNPVYGFPLLTACVISGFQATVSPFSSWASCPCTLPILASGRLQTLTGLACPLSYSDKGVGWNTPPKDYGKWHDLISALIKHLVCRYGGARPYPDISSF